MTHAHAHTHAHTHTHTRDNTILLGCDTALQNNQFPAFPVEVGPSAIIPKVSKFKTLEDVDIMFL
jgi:hypothetical protein